MTCPVGFGGEHGVLLGVREFQVSKEWGTAGGWQQSTENPSSLEPTGLRVYMTSFRGPLEGLHPLLTVLLFWSFLLK